MAQLLALILACVHNSKTPGRRLNNRMQLQHWPLWVSCWICPFAAILTPDENLLSNSLGRNLVHCSAWAHRHCIRTLCPRTCSPGGGGGGGGCVGVRVWRKMGYQAKSKLTFSTCLEIWGISLHFCFTCCSLQSMTRSEQASLAWWLH